MSEDTPGRALRAVLDAAEDAAPVDAVEAVTERLGAVLGATDVSFLMSDLTGRALVRLGDPSRAGSSPLPLQAHAPASEAIRTQTVRVLPLEGDRDRWQVHAPVTERGEVVGLLQLTLPGEPDAATVAEVRATAHALAFVVIANRRHTDLFEWSQRSTPFTLSAEIQRRLLPAASTCEASSFSLAGWLEPAASVGGDTFDYSVARDVLHLSLTDAMGHGVGAALTATLCVNALRLARRGGAGLVEMAQAADAALLEHDGPGPQPSEGFVTGILGRLDLRTGVLSLVNAGHVQPLLVRAGKVVELGLAADLPFGLLPGSGYRASEVTLRPGDRIVLLTDGMLERNAEHLDLDAQVAAAAPLHVREAVRALADAVLRQTGGTLEDDATILVVDWFGDHASPRSTSAGADTARASHTLEGGPQGRAPR
ncbi:serine/threonine-protein phosphatase [Kineococcus sp. NBC_00420]|uniref:PP2C family protein-serine/threonine phosphatase n=1 Tax=unclassified Kineococcus TaxID=2621656 RepID=UPI002E1CCF33